MNEVTPRARRSPPRFALLAIALLGVVSLGIASLGVVSLGVVLLGSCATTALAQQQGGGDGGVRSVERPGRTDLPLPRFVSLRSTEVNLRRGPGTRYPIDWVYRRRDLPVEVLDEFDAWRQIRDHDGTTGWVHQSMIQGERHLMVVGERRSLRRSPDDGGRVLAHLDPGVLCRLIRCEGGWCNVEVAGFEGWLKRSETFGAYPAETYP